MRKLILNLALSLDGFIEGPRGEYDWCFTDLDYGMTRFLSHIDAIFFGRKSFELVSPMGPNAYPGLTRYVFSKTLESAEGAIIICDEPKRNVERIKRMKGKDIWLFGGAELTNSLMELDLVDELQLCVHPIILGDGKPLFKSSDQRKNLKLISAKTYPTGLVQLFYRPVRKHK